MFTGIGRDVLEDMLTKAQAENRAYEKQMAKATSKIDNDASVIRLYQRQVTELQTRGNELIEQTRFATRAEAGMRVMLDMHPLAPLLVELRAERVRRPAGNTPLQLAGFLGDALRAEDDKGATREARRDAWRTVAVMALRLSLDEEERFEIRLRGWKCVRCQYFNGEEKEPQKECASCGTAK